MKLKDVLDGAASLVRTGWMQRGVPPALGETVALHSFYAAAIALELGNVLLKMGVDVDPERAAAIAIAHDLPEVLVGDLPKWSTDRIKNKKEELELEAIDSLNHLEIMKYAREYISLESKEAVLAKVSETLATKWQAEKYVQMGLHRVKEILRSMETSLIELLKTVKENDPAFGEALEHALGELDESL